MNKDIFCFQREEPDVIFVENREYGEADGAQISFTNNKKKKVNQISKAFIRLSTNLGEAKPLFYEHEIEDWDLKYIYLILCTLMIL